jgi:dTDP-4-dehydrorhamnose 3,5-epimerase
MEIFNTEIEGCYLITPDVLEDERGRFVKIVHEPTYKSAGLLSSFEEDYFSESTQGVIRGMHFQAPPKEHAKVVNCVAGEVIDVVLDLRIGSPTFGQHSSFDLSRDNAKALYLAAGIAHGFCALSSKATLAYRTTSSYDQAADSGVKWNSFGFEWPVAAPILSKRDRLFCDFEDFDSPFFLG